MLFKNNFVAIYRDLRLTASESENLKWHRQTIFYVFSCGKDKYLSQQILAVFNYFFLWFTCCVYFI